ncbi:MAG: phosphoenolpyruvate--protein phosphotransferase [Proteobacteria bacterium]|nr:phosphoenolpyruvate--protein phosphotransferase [Pseudomonadota bacterium]
MKTLTILAPLDGWCATLDEVPDPVFAGRMLGEGLAIDPLSGEVRSPCDGLVTTVGASRHAVSIRSDAGPDVLVHVGIDTVKLAGRGFEAHVRAGQRVAAGDRLLSFDLDAVARMAPSLLTPVVATSPAGSLTIRPRAAGPVRAGAPLYDVELPAVTGPSTVAPVPVAAAERRALKVELRHGIHARPAAMLSQRLRAFASDVTVELRGRRASARSVVALMSLGVGAGEEVTLEAAGTDATAALDAFVAALADAVRVEAAGSGLAPPSADAPAPAPAADAGAGRGVTAVGGFAVGTVARLERREIEVTEAGRGAEAESAALRHALATVKARLTRVGEVGGAARREIVGAHVEFLEDPLLQDTAQELLAAGKSAGFAWRTAVRRAIAALRALADPRLRERADDLLDVEAHVLLALNGEARPMNLPLPDRAVLVADELLPSELVALDRTRLAAICLAAGGATSHVAILAAAMDVPMLVGLGARIRDLAEGTTVVVDADAGQIDSAPTVAELRAAERSVADRRRARDEQRRDAQQACHTLDGTRVEVFANVGSTADAVAAVANGAEGCGLLRTEFLFIDRATAPDEAEQLAAYQAIADALGGRPLVLRLMDVGGDKPLPYLPLPAEENPALGLRGIRTALAHRSLLRTQLRAALRVEPAGIVRLLVPMVTDVAELAAVRALVAELATELGRREPVAIGAMIETPASALLAPALAAAADFLSVGSNDLTQYTLAMDRGHPQLAGRADALHPAVLQLVGRAASAAAASGRLAAVCGGVAADAAAVPVLLGLGIRELSVVPAAVPAIKQRVRSLRLADCVALAADCLALESAALVRARIQALRPGSSP